jgi:hypothetical protein
MPPTLVHASLGVLLGAALLGAAFDRWSILLVVTLAVLPDLDLVAAVVLPGTGNALLHSLWLVVLGVALVYWETEVRKQSWLRDRHGWRGIRIAWVGLAATAVAGIGLDLFSDAGVNLLFPVSDRFYAIDDGMLLYSTQDGLIQSYVDTGGPGLVSLDSQGTTATHRVNTWLTPSEDGDRTIYFVREAWQAVVVVAATALIAVRFRGER